MRTVGGGRDGGSDGGIAVVPPCARRDGEALDEASCDGGKYRLSISTALNNGAAFPAEKVASMPAACADDGDNRETDGDAVSAAAGGRREGGRRWSMRTGTFEGSTRPSRRTRMWSPPKERDVSARGAPIFESLLKDIVVFVSVAVTVIELDVASAAAGADADAVVVVPPAAMIEGRAAGTVPTLSRVASGPRAEWASW